MGDVVRLSDVRARRATGQTVNDAGRAAACVAAGERLLTARELARTLSVSVYTIRNYRRDGMPAHPVGGTGFRFILADCLEWLRLRREAAAPPTPQATA